MNTENKTFTREEAHAAMKMNPGQVWIGPHVERFRWNPDRGYFELFFTSDDDWDRSALDWNKDGWKWRPENPQDAPTEWVEVAITDRDMPLIMRIDSMEFQVVKWSTPEEITQVATVRDYDDPKNYWTIDKWEVVFLKATFWLRRKPQPKPPVVVPVENPKVICFYGMRCISVPPGIDITRRFDAEFRQDAEEIK